jgi:hypothetical protein
LRRINELVTAIELLIVQRVNIGKDEIEKDSGPTPAAETINLRLGKRAEEIVRYQR